MKKKKILISGGSGNFAKYRDVITIGNSTENLNDGFWTVLLPKEFPILAIVMSAW